MTLARATDERRGQLRDLLVGIAETRIAANGLQALTARELALEAGCAVGAIYNIFKDMDALIAAVNSRTAIRLEAAVGEAFAREGDAIGPKRQLVLLGLTYLDFVSSNNNLWSAIFALKPNDQILNEMQIAENARLISHVVRPLVELLPTETDDRRLLIARGLFSAVHGIVTLGRTGRLIGVPSDQIAVQITYIVEGFCNGVKREADNVKA